MWLLSTDRAELRWFTEAGSVPGGYAILSHTWGTDEQTLQDVRAINKRYESSGKNPRDFVSSKIRNCCLLAEKYRYRWVWIDSCCIDKTSSTELSEAINSMFKWYWQAEVCFAFLADVPSEDDLRAKDSAFRKSRWHKRAWTLQELIAPAVVIFFSNHWVQLGTKAELAELLEEVTRIPQCILTRQEYYHHTSVANRMSWAANRMTTRVEDQAYCLMGLFNVNMTVIYGEGTRAFRRLQHKIMKHGFSDMSLFAWGRWLSSSAFGDQGLELERNCLVDLYDDSSYLLAPSPSSFLAGFDFTPAHPHPKQHYPPPNSTGEENAPDLRVPFDGPMEVPTATPNNYGTICRLPVFEADGVTVAVLLCENLSHEQIGLLIHHDRDDYDPIRPMHFIGAAFNNVDDAEQEVLMSYRLVTLGDDLYNLQFNGKPVRARWRTMYIQAERQTVKTGFRSGSF
ncbi:hypothetical protein GSI_10170 [Ganoderma sinense ZZ0214-1]|uniref:Uncharacterized protein n=1 Tax=Ganoderma sinense ZZ0214-1 TaxID=1077348 RepID=A0A2G8RZT7_9APHY|nr:hypothetical protein GSI_10170 [Ganoderma sinense ZZ0214-1]